MLVLGIGLGAFLDGIVLHQVLQWHHLVSTYTPATTLEALEVNTFWDGVFHLVSWAVVLLGLLWLWTGRRDAAAVPLRGLIGMLAIGWGVFNIVDQLVFHLALEAHHIRMVPNYQVYDWTYTAFGAALVLGGWRLQPRDGGSPAARA